MRAPDAPRECYRYAVYLNDQLVDTVVGLTRVSEIVGLAPSRCWFYAVNGKTTMNNYRIEIIGTAPKDYNYFNWYSAYKDGVLVAEGISVWDCAELSGYSTRQIRNCAQNGTTTKTG